MRVAVVAVLDTVATKCPFSDPNVSLGFVPGRPIVGIDKGGVMRVAIGGYVLLFYLLSV